MGIYKRGDSPVWWADINVPGHNRVRVSTGTADRIQAQKFHDREKAKRWNQPTQAERRELLSTAVLAWCQIDHRSSSDIQSIAKFMKAYGDRLITAAVKDEDGIDRAMRSFINTPATYTRYRGRIHAIFQKAFDEDIIKEMPKLREWVEVRKPPYNWVRQDRFVDLLRELAAHQRPMVIFAVHTGLRQSNLLQLKWDQIDLKQRILWVHSEDTKANRTIRIPLNDTAMSVLEGQQEQRFEYVFTYRGRPISEIKTAFQNACVRAGLGEKTEIPNRKNKSGKTVTYKGLRWHDLRHTFASWHAQSGTPPQVLKELGGWSSMAMVENYMHLAPSFTAGFANNITTPT